MSVKNISSAILGVGVDDTTIDLFESQYPVPTGVSYNSYVIRDEKTAILDTVDARATDEWMANVTEALAGEKPAYLVVHHMEPDHGANVARLAALYPEMQVVGNAKTFAFMGQFYDFPLDGRTVTAREFLPLVMERIRFLEGQCKGGYMDFNWNNLHGDLTYREDVLQYAMDHLDVSERIGTAAYQNFDVQVFYSTLIDLRGGAPL